MTTRYPSPLASGAPLVICSFQGHRVNHLVVVLPVVGCFLVYSRCAAK